MATLYFAVFSVILSVAAQFLLKAGLSQQAQASMLNVPVSHWQSVLGIATNWLVVGGFSLYGLGAIVWLRVLSEWDVSKAYPLVGLGFALTLLIGLALGEQVSWTRAAGVLLIVVGVMLISRT